MSDITKLNGTCLCGGIEITMDLLDRSFDACHCSICRKWGGGPALTIEAGADVKITGHDQVKVYASSEWAERGFCSRCGTHLFYRLKDKSFYNFALGLFEKTDEFKFKTQIFIDSKPNCYSFADQTTMMTEKDVLAQFSDPSSEAD